LIQRLIIQVERNRADIERAGNSNVVTTQRRRRFLHEEIDTYFNEAEIKSLCFTLDIDYEGLAGDSKSEKALEMVMLMGRHGRKPELIAECKRQRPKIDWDNL